jgi:hypothetical protein
MSNDDLIRRGDAAAIPDYDAGLLNDWGGGNVDWWQDYLRAEIERANAHWSEAIAALPAAQVAVKPLVWVDNPDLGEGGLLGGCDASVGPTYHVMQDGWSYHRAMFWRKAESIEAAKAAAQADYAARIRAALEVGPAHLSARFDADEWHGVLMWTDDGEKTLFDWCTGGGDPDGEFSRVGLRRETSDGRVLYRTYTANGPWGEPAPMLDVAPAPDVAGLVEALRGVMRHMPDHPDTAWQDAAEALAAWEKINE